MPDLGPVERAYGVVFRVVFARMPPESAHHAVMTLIRAIGAVPPAAALVRTVCAPPAAAAVTVAGVRFPSRFGLAAGFDKDAVGIMGLAALGFGHVEVGTVTHRPQPGNPKPRLFRLIEDRALINRMGFNNGGAAAAAERIQRARARRNRPVIGVNIGKSRVVAVEDAIIDYVASTRLLAPVADYLVVNVSSPNTPGLRGLQEVELLEPLLSAVKGASRGVPLFVKIAPDLDDDAVDDIARLVERLGLAGVVATNTTIGRDGLVTAAAQVTAAGAGGLSGPPVAARSLEVLRLLRVALPAGAAVISVGGVSTADDARARIAAGADLVQGYTAFLYRGPGWARELARAGVHRRRTR